jgi:hypothetical protein
MERHFSFSPEDVDGASPLDQELRAALSTFHDDDAEFGSESKYQGNVRLLFKRAS